MSASSLPTIHERRGRSILPRGPQRREAFRMDLAMAVHVDAPVQVSCGLSEVSFAGAGFDCELPCKPGVQVNFRLELPTYGAALVPTSIALQAEVVRVAHGHTGVHFVDLDREQSRAIHELVATQQRVMLAARRSR